MRARLKWGASGTTPIKPRGMHERTYQRILGMLAYHEAVRKQGRVTLENTDQTSIVPIYGGNAEIDLPSWAVGRFVDDARASGPPEERKLPISVIIGALAPARRRCQRHGVLRPPFSLGLVNLVDSAVLQRRRIKSLFSILSSTRRSQSSPTKSEHLECQGANYVFGCPRDTTGCICRLHISNRDRTRPILLAPLRVLVGRSHSAQA